MAISIMLLNFGPVEVNSTIIRNDAKPIIASSKAPRMIINGSGYQDITHQIMNAEIEALTTSTSSIDKSSSDNALIFPLPHSTKLEIIVNNENLDNLPDIERLPSFTDVSNGWLKHFENGMEIQTDDNRLASVLNTARRHLPVSYTHLTLPTIWQV